MKSQVRSALVCLAMVLVLALGFIPTLGITASAADGYTVSFSTPAGVATPEAKTVAAGESVTLPTVEAAKEGYTFVGWTTGVVADTTTAPELFTESYTPTADVTLYATYTYAGEKQWTLVTNAADLAAGDSVVIVASGSNNYAMSTTQSGNNRPAVAVTKSSDKNTITFSTDVQVMTLVAGKKAGTFGFNTGKGYIYAASSSKNYLRTETTLSNNSSWSISIASTGVATIKAQGTNTRNWLRFNSSNSPKIFSCYSTGQNDVSIYKSVGGVTYTTDSCSHKSVETNVIVAATCTTEGRSETRCTACETLIETAVIKALGHAYTDGVCENCGKVDPTAADYSGRFYVATKRSAGNYFYIKGVKDGSKDRFVAVDSKLTELPATVVADDALLVVILEKLADGKYNVYFEGIAGDAKYVGYANDGSNTASLVTKADAIALSVDVLESGLYNIHFTADAERYLSLNNTTGNNYFAFYKGTQAQDLALIPVAEAEEEETVTEISDVNVNLGASLAMKYYVTLAGGESIADYKLVVTMNGKTTVITEYTEQNGKYVFAFTGIAPQCMTDTIKAELVKEDEVVSVKENYSVAQYAKELIELFPDNAELYTLVVNMLFYGAAAQEYRSYNVENLATSVLPATAGQTDIFPSQDGNTPIMSESTNAGVFFTAAGVVFDNVNKIYVKFNANAENVTVKVGDKELAVETLADGQYVVTTDGVYATDFDKMVTFELVVDGETVQTLSYSVNCYCARKANLETAMGKLAHALYVYGVSADAYAAAN